MNKENREWLLKIGWKKFTVSQLSARLGAKPSQISVLLTRNGLTAVTHKDIIATQVISLNNEGKLKSIAHAAELCNVSIHLVREINNEYRLGIPTKQIKSEERKAKELPLDQMLQKRAEFVRPKGEYNQTGSELLDELRGIKTTKRSHTYLTNTGTENEARTRTI